MAKGMNAKKETKKPKKEKAKAGAAASNPLTARLTAAQDKAKGEKS